MYQKEAFGQLYNKERSICGEHTLAPLTKALFLISGDPRVNSKSQW